MARRANLKCACGLFEMIDDEHAIRHGSGPGAKHSTTACDSDPLVKRPNAPEAAAPRVFKIGVTKAP